MSAIPEKLRLTQTVSCAGCAAKIAPGDLARVLARLPRQDFSADVLVGFDTADDAGVIRLNETTALVQTVDFFPPVADDPEMYGQIAANNALNDIFAMGGKPISALSVLCYPQKGDWDDLEKILLGGTKVMNAAGVSVLGGHSIDDKEMKFGYAVTGIIHPDKIVTNAGAKPGDVLVLTKAIGTGAINTAVKQGKASRETEAAAIKAMTTSAAAASKAMQAIGVNACTDVTGFGLLGHAYEVAKASGVSFTIESGRIPLLPDVLKLIAQGMLTRGDKNNRVYVGDTVKITDGVSPQMQSALFDPQTAGGLLISIEAAKAFRLLEAVEGAAIVGRVDELSDKLINVV